MEANSILAGGFFGRDAEPEYASRKLAVFALAGLSALFVVSVLYRPSTGQYFTLCGFKNFTGLPCPGCGLTHSFCALAKGDFASAFAYNLIGPPLFLAFMLIWLRAAGVVLGRIGAVRRFDQFAQRIKVVRLFATGFAIYGIARIAYLLVFDPGPFAQSPVSRLVAGMFR